MIVAITEDAVSSPVELLPKLILFFTSFKTLCLGFKLVILAENLRHYLKPKENHNYSTISRKTAKELLNSNNLLKI